MNTALRIGRESIGRDMLTRDQLRGMSEVLRDIATDIEDDYPFQANSLRNMAAEMVEPSEEGS